jgi:amino acid transporter
MSVPPQLEGPKDNRVRIVVATSVMLTFISFWRAAAIVLNDLASSAYYALGIAEQAAGKAAPWLVLGVMFFSFAVRAVYVESCAMFVRGGVYRVVKEALGSALAKVSVSALMFDYVLTGPVSGVSAGQYIAGLINEVLLVADTHGWVPSAVRHLFGGTPHVPVDATAVFFALAVTLYFWWQNIKGIEESSDKAMKVMQITTVMAVVLLGWGLLSVVLKGASLPPWPVPANLHFSEEALGFLKHTSLARTFGLFGILMAFGHAILAMSGEETLAQVYREIASPKVKNLKRTALIMAFYSLIFTGVSALLVVMLVPDNIRMLPENRDNVLGAMAMYLVGPQLLRLLFRAFVVFVGFLILAGGVNTAIVGSNGVLNRVAEDGVLTDWFRKPHRRFGTTSRILNLIVGLQVFTIIVSHGDVYLLGEAYAFGVIWSFTMKALAMLVLRYKDKNPRAWKVPPNFYIGKIEIPVGLASIFLVLLATSITNLFTKSIATISGIIFTTVLFAVFSISERINRRKFAHAERHMQEQFQLVQREDVARDTVGVRPGNLLVTIRDYTAMHHLRYVLERTDTKEQDVVVMEAHLLGLGTGEHDLASAQIFSDYEQTLFTRAVSIAESYGKRISLLVVPARDVWSAIVHTAISLESSAVVAGLSTKISAQEQAFLLGRAWEAAPEPKRQFVLQIVKANGEVESFRIGPHTPTITTDDIYLTHRMWLRATQERGLEKLHHSAIISLALARLAREFSRDPQGVLKALRDGADGQAEQLDKPLPSGTGRQPPP